MCRPELSALHKPLYCVVKDSASSSHCFVGLQLQFPAPAFGRAQQPGRDTSASPQGIPTQIPQANQSDRLAPRINRLFPEPTGGSVRAAAAGAPRQQAQAPGPARPHLSPDRNPGHPPESQATPSGDVQAACSSADPERGAGAGNERVSASTSARPVVTVPGVATPGDARAGAAPSSSQGDHLELSFMHSCLLNMLTSSFVILAPTKLYPSQISVVWCVYSMEHNGLHGAMPLSQSFHFPCGVMIQCRCSLV